MGALLFISFGMLAMLCLFMVLIMNWVRRCKVGQVTFDQLQTYECSHGSTHLPSGEPTIIALSKSARCSTDIVISKPFQYKLKKKLELQNRPKNCMAHAEAGLRAFKYENKRQPCRSAVIMQSFLEKSKKIHRIYRRRLNSTFKPTKLTVVYESDSEL